MDWKSVLRNTIPKYSINYYSSTSILVGIFRNVTLPEIFTNSRGKICVPDRFSIVSGESKELFYSLLKHEVLSVTPIQFQKALLDLLFIILNRNIYNVIRFQCSDTNNDSKSKCFTLVNTLMRLLDDSISNNVHISILKRIIYLIGIVGAAGVNLKDLTSYLALLRKPSELTASLLQAFKLMLGQDQLTRSVMVKKASPNAIFNFGGNGAGFTTQYSMFPFTRDYQYCTWFRIENFEIESKYEYTNPQQKAFNSTFTTVQHLISWENSAHKGMDVFINKRILTIAISHYSRPDNTIIELSDYPLQAGVWYHLHIKHSKPRLSIFSSDELTVYIDQQLVLQENIRFPNLGKFPETKFSFGLNFDGQMSPIYLFSECISLPIIDIIARLDAGKPVESFDNGFNPIAVDLMHSISTSDRKIYSPIMSKVSMAFHPSRCLRNHVLEVHSGRHAKFEGITQSWIVSNVRDLLNALGGISCLYPLFPRLFIENNLCKTTATINNQIISQNAISSPLNSNSFVESMPDNSGNSPVGYIIFTGLGTSLAELLEPADEDNSDLDYSVLSLLRSEKEDCLGERCIGLLLSIIAKCIAAHRNYQLELLNSGGIEMIEYALTCVPQEILQGEGELCVVSLIQLQTAASDLPILERKIRKLLLCNFRIWYRASFQFVSSLMSVILAAIKNDPVLFIEVLGVKSVIDALEYFTDFDYTKDEYYVMKIKKEDSNLEKNNELQDKVSTKATEFQTDEDISRNVPSNNLNDTNEIDSSNKFSPERMKNRISMKVMNNIIEDEEVDFDSRCSSNKISSFAEFSTKTEIENSINQTPRSVIRRGTLIKRLKSFKSALTEVIQIKDTEDKNDINDNLEEINGINLTDSINEANSNEIDEQNNIVEFDLNSNTDVSSSSTLPQIPIQSAAILERHTSNESLAASEISNTELPAPQTNEQRKYLRDCLYAMIVAIVQQDGTEKELAPILEHLVVSNDLFLSNEVAQILLYLIIEGGSKFISAMIAACTGSEEFASFVLLYLIHQPYEELRCTGIRILIHFYLRIDQVAASFISLTMKQRRRQSIIYRSMSNIAAQVAGRDQGLQRLQLCGGLALLVEIVSSHSKLSSELTYSALLELLLTKPGVKSQVTVQYTDLFDLSSSSYAVNYLPHNSAPQLTANNSQTNVFRGPSKDPKINTNIGKHNLAFVAAYLSPDQVHDEDIDMMNSTALPIFFELLPKLPVRVQGQVYSDLLALLKHSESNCHAFISASSWHLCMFGLVCQLVSEKNSTSSKTILTNNILYELEKWSGFLPEIKSFLSSKNIKKKQLFRVSSEFRLDRGLSLGGEFVPPNDLHQLSISVPPISNLIHDSTEIDYDMWFALGMKIYSTLLLHSIEFKYGWKEIDRSISQSYESDIGYSVAQTILSHVLNEVTFSMRSKYRELQRLAKSKDSAENQEANDRIENLLCLLLTASELALVDQQCALTGIQNFHLCKLRVHHYSEICREYASIKDVTYSHPAENIKSTLTDAQIESILSPSEMRNILDKTEQCLSSSLTVIDETEASSPLKNDHINEYKPSNGHSYHKYLNFSHTWHDITIDSKENEFNSNAPPSPSEKANLLKTNSFSISNLNVSSSSFQFKSTEELLHPLERNHDIFHGKLILVLQTLRFFDIIFWPNNTVLRNAEMLRFNKEELAIANDMFLGSFKLSDKKRPMNSIQSYPMSICSTVMRMCLFILTQLSPITHLAILNLKRIRMLVHSLDKIPQFKTPTHDWLLAILLHTTLGMQRIAHSLEPVYAMLGITFKIHVENVGPWNDSYDDFDRLDSREAELFDSASEDNEAMLNIQKYFDSSPGRNLIRNIRASLMLLADAFEFHHAKLSNSLEERFFRSLWVLVEHFRSDCANNAAPIDLKVPCPDEVEKEPTTGIIRSLSLKLYRHESIPIITGQSLNNEAVPEDLFDTGPYSPSSASASSSSSIASTFSPKFAKINTRESSRGRSPSETSELSEASARTVDDENNNVSDDKEKFAMRGSTSPTPVRESSEESFKGVDILLVLKWLRYPYFKLNPFRNIGVIKAVDALDYLEARSVNQFSKDIQGLKETLEEQRDLAVKSVEEMTELKELSIAVKESMLSRHESRVMTIDTSDILKLKNVAAKWHDCLQRFEEDWSPWRVNLTGNSSKENSMAHYELSKHRDFFLRRMVLTRLPESISHKDAAYLEGKIKDQEQFKAELLHGPTKSTSTTPSSNNITNNNRFSLPFRSRSVMDKSNSTSPNNSGNNNLWGDEEDDINNDDVSNNQSTGIAGGIATLLTGGLVNEKRPSWTLSFKWAADEKYLFEFEATQIQLEQVVAGIVLLTNKCIYFHSRKNLGGLTIKHQPFIDRRWYLDRIIEAYGRRYLLQNCAIELFFIDTPELFLAFKSLTELQKFFRALRRQFIPLLITPPSLNPRYAFDNSPWTELWRRRLISNFEYLMRLNIMAGRSFNDITQYPVFPWVLSDYTSNELDLNNPKSFRKLDLPVGALNPTRLEEFLERYRSFDDDSIPKFMYGSHYSSAGIVLHYMIRQEPFTTLAINLQGGRFDCPDRIFFDLSRTWQNCNESMSDVKEMIPELFCCPEILLNTNKLPLGNLQEESQLVDDVKLPPWAKNAYDFIRYNRAALESEYVSEHLPGWIDLIFGYKQTGPNAVAAHNVFVYLTYENAIDIDSIKDQLQKEAAKAQVMHYGQTPSQLLVREHPKRLARDECIQPLCSDRKHLGNIRCFTPSKQMTDGSPIIAISCSGDRLIACHSNLNLSYYRWTSFPDDDHNPLTCRYDKTKEIPSTSLSISEEILRGRNSLSQSSTPPIYSEGSNNSMTTNMLLEPSSLLGAFRNSFNRSNSNLNPSPKIQKTVIDELFPQINKSISPLTTTTEDILLNNKDTSTGATTTIPALTHMKVAMNSADIGSSRVITCSYWDNSLKIHSVESLREVGSSSSGHKGEINCIQQGTSNDCNTLITGGVDGTCRVWIFEKNSLAIAYTPDPYYSEGDANDEITTHTQTHYDSNNANIPQLICVHTLCGHLSSVSSISYSSILDLVLSGGLDGLLCIHSVRSGKYIRCIMHPACLSADLVLISHAGYIIAHSWIDLQIHVFWLNGQHLFSKKLPRKIEVMIVDSTGLVLITGSTNGIVTLHEISNLEELLLLDVSSHGAIKSMSFNEDNQFLLIGSEDGIFSIATDSEARLKSFTNLLQKAPILGAGI